MKILLKKSQKSGMLGKVSFLLTVKGQLNDDEMNLVRQYSLGNELLVHHEKVPPGDTIFGAAYKAMKDTVLTTDALIGGTTFTCKNVAELLEIEAQVIEAATNLRAYLHAASGFDGEEVIDIDELAERER